MAKTRAAQLDAARATSARKRGPRPSWRAVGRAASSLVGSRVREWMDHSWEHCLAHKFATRLPYREYIPTSSAIGKMFLTHVKIAPIINGWLNAGGDRLGFVTDLGRAGFPNARLGRGMSRTVTKAVDGVFPDRQKLAVGRGGHPSYFTIDAAPTERCVEFGPCLLFPARANLPIWVCGGWNGEGWHDDYGVVCHPTHRAPLPPLPIAGQSR